jgi:hypothetical protein
MALVKLLNPLAKFTKEMLFDDDFIHDINNIVGFAHTLGVSFLFTSGFRKDTNVQGAIVTPAQMSNHLVGCAFDCNMYLHNKLYNSELLAGVLPVEIQKVIDYWKNMDYRWGGDFKKKDVVHFDTALNLRHPELWKDKYREYHEDK